MSSFIFQQDIFPEKKDIRIHCQRCNEADWAKFLPQFIDSIEDNRIGISTMHGTNGASKTLVISSNSRIIAISISPKAARSSRKANSPFNQLQDLLCNPKLFKYSLEMDKVSTALFLDFGLTIVAAKDLLSLSAENSRHSLEACLFALGGSGNIAKQAVKRVFSDKKVTCNDFERASLQAWAVCHAASIPAVHELLQTARLINTFEFDKEILQVLCRAIRDANRLWALKPIRVKNDVHEKHNALSNDKISLVCKRYKSKISDRPRNNQTIRIESIGPDGKIKVSLGRVKKAEGRRTDIGISRGGLPTSQIHSVETIGKDPPNSAESSKTWVILNALQGVIDLSTHPFLSKMWLGKNSSWDPVLKTSTAPSFHFPSDRELNPSQRNAVDAILSNEDINRIVVIHGPPGTGKTTVISAAVTSVMASLDKERTIWLVAQSNVAVKNIAEKLASVEFWDFRILVSKDFHFDWHEHLYEKIEHNVIRSDSFPPSVIATERMLLGSRVLLCTLSMLSNDKLATIARVVPLQTIIFDEASQIEIGDYLPLLVRFRLTLHKLVFIGDDKQLAPYGSTDIPDLESIFEKPHLRENSLFLNIQYRMPIPIGNFISKHVYNGKLKSEHMITDPQCCRFVDVSKGKEVSEGRSWKNLQEIDAVIKIAERLQLANKSFRIITPYDPQRHLLEKGLQDAKLAWEDKCFNVDAFQGNEDDYIIISLVRSDKLGFLQDPRRTNVMLTRCKKGMMICTSRRFIEGPAAESLVGKLSRFLPASAWIKGGGV